MFNISKYLNTISKKVDSAENIKFLLAESIKKSTDLTVDFKNIEIKNFIAVLAISPTLKNIIFINKKGILDDFSSKTSEKIIDIK